MVRKTKNGDTAVVDEVLEGLRLDAIIGRDQRMQIYRALQQRKDDLVKLSKKASDLGVDTDPIETALLQTTAALDSVIGQGDLFPQTPIEEQSEEE